jgi:hypothetical protein
MTIAQKNRMFFMGLADHGGDRHAGTGTGKCAHAGHGHGALSDHTRMMTGDIWATIAITLTALILIVALLLVTAH